MSFNKFFCSFFLLTLIQMVQAIEVKKPSVSSKGSSDAICAERDAAVAAGFEPITEANFASMIKVGTLVSVPDDGDIIWHRTELVAKYAYIRPYALKILKAELVVEFWKNFRNPINIASAARTVERQDRLRKGKIKGGGNATSSNTYTANGKRHCASSHIYGTTVDIGYKAYSPKEVAWLEGRLLLLERDGIVQMTKERHHACFHVHFYPKPRSKVPSKAVLATHKT